MSQPSPTAPSPTADFLVLGVSCRAEAASIIQAGHQCAVIDLFADWDTKAICDAYRVASIDSIFSAASKMPNTARVVLAAGIENRLAEIEHLEDRFQICGSDSRAIRASRNPYMLHDLLSNAGIPVLDVCHEIPKHGHWMAKSKTSGGGQQTLAWHPDDSDDDQWVEIKSKVQERDRYFQQHATGRNLSASFVAFQDRCLLLGLAEQFVKPLGDAEYTFWGVVGPIELPEQCIDKLSVIAELVASACQLRGWFGIDFILQDGFPMLLEINPRMTASMPLFSDSLERSVFQLHLDATRKLSCPKLTRVSNLELKGIAYVYNRTGRAFKVSQALFETFKSFARVVEDGFLTDIPQAGAVIPRLSPICTVHAAGTTIDDVEAELKRLESVVIDFLKPVF